MTVTRDNNGTKKIVCINSELDYKEKCLINRKSVQKFFKKRCSRDRLLQKLPVVTWLPKYQLSYLLDDLVAGFTVALTAISQSIAYAVIADLEPQYGLYSGFMGCFVYFIFGSVKDVTIGPTAIMANIIHKYASQSIDFAVLATFLTGIIIFILGLLNLGFIVDFISMPVNIGFVTSAAIVVIFGQLKFLMCYGGSSDDFLEAIKGFVENVTNTKLWDTVLGVFTIIFLVLLKNITKLKWGGPKLKIVLKYLSLARNCIVVLGGTLLAYILTIYNVRPFTLTRDISAGLPNFKLPPFTTTVNNQTLTFGDMLNEFGVNALSVPLIATLEHLVISKVFSKGKVLDASQELIALGLCNICGSFVQSIPVTGSFSRTAINNASGVKTALGGVFTGVIVLLALKFLSSSFSFIPKTTLAAVIIVAMFYMIELNAIKEIWKTRKIDIVPFCLTLICCLLVGLEYGIIIGAACSIVFTLTQTARPKLDFKVEHLTDSINCLIVTPDQSLVYSAAGFLRNEILEKLSIHTDCEIIVINGEFIQSIDITVANSLLVVATDVQILQRKIFFWEWKKQPKDVIYRFNEDLAKLFLKSKSSLNELTYNKIEINHHV